MKVIIARNVNAALPVALRLLTEEGVDSPSRAGHVRYSPVPVTTEFEYPDERVLFTKHRDANPVFHLYESLWMLAGRDDVPSLTRFNGRMSEFSDDGQRFWGSAYGYRWRRFFGFDQLKALIELLRAEPLTRRAVLTMWSPRGDLISVEDGGLGASVSKDVPCNQQIFFSAVSGRLDMTVTNRSNDVIWGAYGANQVQFSTLQEFVAGALDLEMGRYWQVSNNFHMYDERPDVQRLLAAPEAELCDDRYRNLAVWRQPIYPAGVPLDDALAQIEAFVDNPDDPHFLACENGYLRIAAEVVRAHRIYREGGGNETLVSLNDWLTATREWINRRIAAKGQNA